MLLVHPGGPFFQKKDDGAWSIPKGEAGPEEDLLDRAKIEFEEEIGFIPAGMFQSLGSIKQKGGKTVHAGRWKAIFPLSHQINSNSFEMEWPPHSGRRQAFPEIDRAEFFREEVARQKINPAQAELLDRLGTFLKE